MSHVALLVGCVSEALAKEVITFGCSIDLTGVHFTGAQGQVEAYAV